MLAISKKNASLINLNVACCFNLASKLIFWTHNDRLYNIYKICVILDWPSLAYANTMNDFTHRHFKVINGGFGKTKNVVIGAKQTETVRQVQSSRSSFFFWLLPLTAFHFVYHHCSPHPTYLIVSCHEITS